MTRILTWFWLAALLGCQGIGDDHSNSSGDGGTDSDTDVDTDADSDSDSDSDGGVDPVADDDGDGLSNSIEIENGTDPNDPDSDDDGFSDFVEWYAGTDPNDPDSNPKAEGNFYFLMPYTDPPEPTEDTLVFQTNIQFADVFFAMDTTGSMGGAITNLKNTLTSTIIPEIAEIIPFAWFGVGYFDDYPVSPFGDSASGDKVFALLQEMTGDTAEAQAGVNLLATHYGADGPESQVPALWAIATGGSLGTYLEAQTSCPAGQYGYPCFRPGAIPIIMLMTDITFHNGPGNYSPYGTAISPEAPSYNYAVAALDTIHAKVLPIYNGSVGTLGQTHCENIALDTGAAIDDVPLVFPINYDGTGLGTSVVDAVEDLATGVPFDIETEIRDNETDAVDA
ncbi:MAG: hypothetical protein M0R80_30450, partial [Proteobacteria bacterium]|nr:hypothetical protein [Pseudomonadota bacterium]